MQQWVNPEYADVVDELLPLADDTGAPRRGFLIPATGDADEAQPE